MNFDDLHRRYFVCAKWIFALLLVAYAAKSADFKPMSLDPVQVAWVIIFCCLVANLNHGSLLLVAFVYSILGAFYVIREVLVKGLEASLDYLKIFPPYAMLTYILCLLMSFKYIDTPQREILGGKTLDVVLISLIVVWAVFIADQQLYVDYAVREYGAVNYLTISDLMALLALIAMSDGRQPTWLKISWMIAAGIGLMMLGSRSSVISFFSFALLSLTIVHGPSGYGFKKKSMLWGVLIIFLSILVFFGAFNETITYRMLTFLEISNDESAAARNDLLVEYLFLLDSRPACFFVGCAPEAGNYVHNIISVVQYFGAAGLLFLAWAIVSILLAFSLRWRPMALPVLLYSAFQLAFFRSWVSMVFPLFIAYSSAATLYLVRVRSSVPPLLQTYPNRG